MEKSLKRITSCFKIFHTNQTSVRKPETIVIIAVNCSPTNFLRKSVPKSAYIEKKSDCPTRQLTTARSVVFLGIRNHLFRRDLRRFFLSYCFMREIAK